MYPLLSGGRQLALKALFNIQRGIIAGIFLRGLVGDSRSFENLGIFVVFSCYADGIFVVGLR